MTLNEKELVIRVIAMPADSRHKAVLTARLRRTARKLGKTTTQLLGASAA